MSLRVVLADDSYLVREGTRRLLVEGDEVAVVAAVGTAGELVEAVDRHAPDAAVTDIRMPAGALGGTDRMAGIAAAHAIRAQAPRVGVVVLSQYADVHYALELFRTGTPGLAYLLKDRVGDRTELLRAIRETAAGGSVVDPLVVDRLVRRGAATEAAPAGPGLARLTEREQDVLRQMAQGQSNAGIAATLHLSESAVEKHISSIFGKLGLAAGPETHRRVAAVLAYLRQPD